MGWGKRTKKKVWQMYTHLQTPGKVCVWWCGPTVVSLISIFTGRVGAPPHLNKPACVEEAGQIGRGDCSLYLPQEVWQMTQEGGLGNSSPHPWEEQRQQSPSLDIFCHTKQRRLSTGNLWYRRVLSLQS